MLNKHNQIQNLQYFFVCLFFASLNFEVFSPIVEQFSVSKMVAILYMASLLITPQKLFSTKDFGAPMASVIIMFLLMIFSSMIHGSRQIFDFSIFLNIIMFWMLLNHTRKDVRVFDEGLFWFSVSSCFVGICSMIGLGVAIGDDMRVTVFGENANNLGFKMGLGTLFLINYCLNHTPSQQIYKPWLLLMIIPMVSLLLGTASRSSVIFLAVGCILFVLLRPSKKMSTKVLWLVIGSVLLLWGYKTIQKQDVLMKRMERTINEGSLSTRDEIWAVYGQVIRAHPTLGVGFSGGEKASREQFGYVRSPHNVFLEVALYSGVIGLSFFAFFMFLMFRGAWRYYIRLQDIGPLMTCVALLMLVLSGQALSQKMFWAFAAYAISFPIYKNRIPILSNSEE